MGGRTKYLLALVAPALAGVAACSPPAPQTSAYPIGFVQAPADANGLVGSTPDVLNAEFGQPTLRRSEGTAQVWLYHSASCGLDLILTPDNTGTPRVALASPTQDSAEPGNCTTDLQRAHIAATLEHASTS
jgi:hypothetical protein